MRINFIRGTGPRGRDLLALGWHWSGSGIPNYFVTGSRLRLTAADGMDGLWYVNLTVADGAVLDVYVRPEREPPFTPVFHLARPRP